MFLSADGRTALADYLEHERPLDAGPASTALFLSDASIGSRGPEWAKTRYGIATQTLPNGYCGLPVQKPAPHANAPLTCPVFLTGPEFLPELRQQRTRTLTLIDNATGCGHTRVAEMNQQVADNLDRMIGELETGHDQTQETAHAG
jgi:hypothetical protein